MWCSPRIQSRATPVFALYKWLGPSCYQRFVTLCRYTRLVFQHKNISETGKQLIRNFSSLCNWFVDIKSSLNFGQDKTRWILFGTKHKLRNTKALNIVYNGTEIKEYAKLKYLGCVLDRTLSLVSQWFWM